MDINDLVTVPITSKYSNVYKLVMIVNEKEGLVCHPLFPTVLLKYNIKDLDKATVSPHTEIEKCIEYIYKNKNLFDYNKDISIEALTFYFLLNKKLSSEQKHEISKNCGKIATIKLEENLEAAIDLINANSGLLDSFNKKWYSNLKKVFTKKVTPSIKEWNSVFNIAGYILAQLEERRIPYAENPNDKKE